MVLNNSENDKLFAKPVPVSLKDVYTNQTRTSHLFLTIEWQDTSAGMYNRKVLVLSLTDNNDPFFLYNLHLSEEEFQTLKHKQDLLINFASFPQHIIDYIEMCLLEEKNPQPKFLLVFTINGKLGNVASNSQFDIIETNQFKHLTHLSLEFAAATEAAIKQYIVTCFKNLKEDNRQLQVNLAFSEQDKKDKLTAKQHLLSSKEQELEFLRKESASELAMKESKHSRELQEERERFHDKLKEEESRFEREKKEKDHNFRKETQQLESRVNALDSLNKELQDKNYKHESTIRDLKSKILSLEDEIRRLKNNLQSSRHKCENLQSESKDKQLHINRQDEIISDLQQELQNKDHSISKLNQQIEFEARQKKSLEAELEGVKLQLEMVEKARKVLIKDNDELNDSILNLQEKIRKFKAKSELAVKYKQTIDEKEKNLQDVKKATADLNFVLEAKNSEIKSLTDSRNSVQAKLEELEKELKNKQSLFKWMHRLLTDNGIFPQYTPSSNLVTSPSTIAQQKQLVRIAAGQNSPSPENSPSVITSKQPTSKSVRFSIWDN